MPDYRFVTTIITLIMKLSSKTNRIFFIAIILTVFSFGSSIGQSGLPEILQTGTLQEQLDYIEDRTLIYNNFRAIREDMFIMVKNNSLDSLDSIKSDKLNLELRLKNIDEDMDSLNAILEYTRDERDQAIENRDSMVFLGASMSKTGYNMTVWTIITVLAVLLALTLITYARNRTVTLNTLSEIDDLKDEFGSYKKNSREKREKLVMEHFQELKKYKEQLNL